MRTTTPSASIRSSPRLRTSSTSRRSTSRHWPRGPKGRRARLRCWRRRKYTCGFMSRRSRCASVGRLRGRARRRRQGRRRRRVLPRRIRWRWLAASSPSLSASATPTAPHSPPDLASSLHCPSRTAWRPCLRRGRVRASSRPSGTMPQRQTPICTLPALRLPSYPAYPARRTIPCRRWLRSPLMLARPAWPATGALCECNCGLAAASRPLHVSRPRRRHPCSRQRLRRPPPSPACAEAFAPRCRRSRTSRSLGPRWSCPAAPSASSDSTLRSLAS